MGKSSNRASKSRSAATTDTCRFAASTSPSRCNPASVSGGSRKADDAASRPHVTKRPDNLRAGATRARFARSPFPRRWHRAQTNGRGPMTFKATCCSLALLAAAGLASGQGSRAAFGGPHTRSLAECTCSFTLPTTEWEWSERVPVHNGKVTALARTRSGLSLIFRCDPVPPAEIVSEGSYAAVEAQMLAPGHWEKAGSRHLTFKGVPAYWLDLIATRDGHGQAVLLFFSDNKSYRLQFTNDQGPVGEEAELIFNGFNFIGAPRPMLPPGREGDGQDRGENDPAAKASGRGQRFAAGGGLIVTLGFA